MENQQFPRYDMFEIERQARIMRAEATRDAFKAFAAWLRRPLRGGTKLAQRAA